MDLGQTFTKQNIAQEMVSFFTLPEGSTVLDPCFGKGAFIDALLSDGRYLIEGIEIYDAFFGEYNKKHPDLNLSMDNFLSFIPTKKYDGIVMNPPYIRHEKMADLASYGMDKKTLRSQELYSFLPPTSNIFMYFIVKAIDCLRDGGELIAIFPSIWLQKRSDPTFMDYVKTFDSKIVKYVKSNGFEREALVETVILKLIKTRKKSQLQVTKKDKEIFNNSKPLSSVSKVRRGLTTGWNEFFINPEMSLNCTFKTKKILSTPRQISGYSTKQASTDVLLCLDDDLSKTEEDYVEKYRTVLRRGNGPKTLKTMDEQGIKWWKIKSFDCYGIIFGYIIRDRVRFILNEDDLLIRDNFYIIRPNDEINLLHAVLNSSYTRIQLEQIGKRYGNGVLKIQKYDVDSILVPDFDTISKADRSLLNDYSVELKNTGYEGIINKIDDVLSHYSPYSVEEVRTMINDKIEERKVE